MDEYISKDEAINAIKSLESSMPAKDNYAKGYDAALGRVQIAVRAVPPAADVQPVRRGKWIGDEVIQCSICNFTLNGNAFKRIVHKHFKYCPNCGARMDGGADDENT